MWIVKIALTGPYTFIILALLIVVLSGQAAEIGHALLGHDDLNL